MSPLIKMGWLSCSFTVLSTSQLLSRDVSATLQYRMACNVGSRSLERRYARLTGSEQERRGGPRCLGGHVLEMEIETPSF